MQITPAVQVQDGAIGRGRAVEGDLFAHRRYCLLEALLPACRREQARVADAELIAGAARFPQTGVHERHRDLPQVALGGEAVHKQPVGDLGGHARHPRPDRGEHHRRRPPRVGVRGEHRRHQRVLIELAAEVQPFAVLPARPDGPQRQVELPHPRGRVGPRHAEAPLDVRLDLRTETEDETARAERVQIICHRGHGHRVACEGHSDGGAQL